MTAEKSPLSPVWFVCALLFMAAGMALAWSELAQFSSPRLPPSAAAEVAGRMISREELARAINAANQSRRQALNKEQQQAVLQRLVDEQLLLQYGLDLGLAKDNASVRKTLVQAVMGLVRANTNSADLTEQEMRDWYANNQALFTQPGQRHLRYFRVLKGQRSEAELAANAAAARQALIANGGFTEAEKQRWALEQVSYLPNRMLPLNKLRDYLGASLLEATLELQAGQVTEPLAINNGLALMQVLAVQGDEPLSFEAVKTQLPQAISREQGEQLLGQLLEELRQDYQPQIARDWQ